MFKKRHRLFLILLCLLTMALPLGAQATTFGYSRVYHYPAITFIVLGASSKVDMRVSMVLNNGEEFRTIPEKETRLWESYFRIYRQGVEGKSSWFGNQKDFTDAVVHIADKERSYDIPLPYEDFHTDSTPEYIIVNMKDGSLSLGIPTARRWAFFFIHLAIYLLVESFVFWRMGFKGKRTWRFFLIYTAIVKGLVCIFIRKWLNVDVRFYIAFAALTLFLMMVDVAVFLFALDEDRNKLGKFSGLANALAGFLVYEAMLRLPM